MQKLLLVCWIAREADDVELELQSIGTVRGVGLDWKSSAEYGLHFAQTTDLTREAQAESEIFIA